jgi:hypothetical protein
MVNQDDGGRQEAKDAEESLGHLMNPYKEMAVFPKNIFRIAIYCNDRIYNGTSAP